MFRTGTSQPEDYVSTISRYEDEKQRRQEIEDIFRMVDDDHDG
jgi:hypothetical protein